MIIRVYTLGSCPEGKFPGRIKVTLAVHYNLTHLALPAILSPLQHRACRHMGNQYPGVSCGSARALRQIYTPNQPPALQQAVALAELVKVVYWVWLGKFK